MNIPFVKMQGAGNDYVYLDCLDGEPKDPAALAKAMSPRHTSVGADGLVLICRSEVADAKMRMFNADGSEGLMCGNAIRCVAKYLADRDLVRANPMAIETRSGVKEIRVYLGEDGAVCEASVDMGRASFAAADVPVVCEGDEFVDRSLVVAGTTWRATCVSMGNPHVVVFVDDPQALDLPSIGPAFEHHPAFPERVNTEFVRVEGADELEMRVWERGSGETYACGTGACAAVAAAVRLGDFDPEQPVTVHLKGGDLEICVDWDWDVEMCGPAVEVYEGVYHYDETA